MEPRSRANAGGGSEESAARVVLADLIEQNRLEIVESWIERLHELKFPPALSREDLMDSLPEVLHILAERLRQPGRPALDDATLAARHGEQRFSLHISLETLVAEYLLLRDELVKFALEHGDLRGTEYRTMNDFVSFGLAKATEAHARCRERQVQREAADQLRESQRVLSELFATMPSYAALTRGPQHVIELITEPLKALWGGRDPTGKPHHEAYPELGAEHFRAWDGVYALARPFRAQEIEAWVDTGGPNPRRMFFDLTLLPRRGADGTVEGVAAFAFDVTDRRDAEDELRRRALFEQQLVGIVSHDLRSPLTAVMFGVEALLRRGDLSEPAIRTALRMRSSSQRASRLVDDLLDFSQARLGGSISIRLQPVHLAEVCLRAIEELRMSHPERTIAFEVAGDVSVRGDGDRLAQVVGNLVSNALKFSPSDAHVVITLQAVEGGAEIAVFNPGPSIPADAQQRIFEPLQQVFGASRTPGRSLGLGLFIVKQLVEAHGGRVALRASDANGTTFSVWLPSAGPSPETQQAGPALVR
ncbi:MAG: PAS domain-containing sensor histidine kinase [Myxococcales bacterium]|nr:PAS domain-containing sensor histidine kinase [Myxococcales bacterium]